MGYKSKFKGAEIDARLEKMVNVTYAELVALRDEGKLIAGQMYRMTDYETTCTWENTQVAGHPFDLVLTALDSKTLDEKCSAIWSERDTDGYFANSNLAAWDVRYCLDNDIKRFDWALMGGHMLLIYDDYGEYAAVQDGTTEIEGVTYYKWSASNGWAVFYTKTINPQQGEEIIGVEIGYEDNSWTAYVAGFENRPNGKGVIYRLIDEVENCVHYDFKNIMFALPLTEGVLDGENGIETFCYTFSILDDSTHTIEDISTIYPDFCFRNSIGLKSKGNAFLNRGLNGCMDNTIGDECVGNIFGDQSVCNVLEDYCENNCFGDSAASNILRIYCSDNFFKDSCYENKLGISCRNNNIGEAFTNNILGNYVSDNTFCDFFINNVIDYNCQSNKFVNDSTGSFSMAVQNYHISNISDMEIHVARQRWYNTYIMAGQYDNIEYCVDDILNQTPE